MSAPQAKAASALLSAPVLRSIMREGPDSRLANQTVSALVESGLALGVSSIRALIWRCDRWLSRHHRNDLVYRKAVLGQMVPKANAIALPEFRIGRSIVDFLVVNESLHAIEIKSDLDSVARLAGQLREYRKIAPFVSLIASGRLVERVLEEPEFSSVGLSWLDSVGQMIDVRAARFSQEFLDTGTVMRSLRRVEYLGVLSSLGCPVPKLPNTKIFSYALDASQRFEPLVYHDAVVRMLRDRTPRAGRSVIDKLPRPVHPTVLKLDPTRHEVAQLKEWFDREV